MKTAPLIYYLLFAALAAGCRRETASQPAAEPSVVGDSIIFPAGATQLSSLAVAPVQSRAPADARLFGRLIWNDDCTVRVFTPFAGRVRRVLVEAGEVVAAGAPLAEIESSDFAQAQADARKATSDWQLATRNLARERELLAHGAAPQKDVEAAEADAARADSERLRAAAKLAVYGAKTNAVDGVFILPSPLAGTIVEKNLNPGQEVRSDQMLANMPQFTAPLFVVSDPSRLWIQIDASEADASHLRPGSEFAFTSRAFPEHRFAGRVEVVSQFIDPNTRTIKVRGRVLDTQHLLKAEMFVNVEAPEDGGESVSVPSMAIYLKGEKHYLFVEEQPGKYARHEVEVGYEQGGNVLVRTGVRAGERVVTDGCILLQQMME